LLIWLGFVGYRAGHNFALTDPTAKLEALAVMAPPMLRPVHFRTPDKLLAMLNQAGQAKNYQEWFGPGSRRDQQSRRRLSI